MIRSVSSPIAVSMTIGTSDWERNQRARSRPDFAGQHQVEHHELVMSVRPGPAGFLTVAHRGDTDLLFFEKTGEQIADLAIIVDHQDVRTDSMLCYIAN